MIVRQEDSFEGELQMLGTHVTVRNRVKRLRMRRVVLSLRLISLCQMQGILDKPSHHISGRWRGHS